MTGKKVSQWIVFSALAAAPYAGRGQQAQVQRTMGAAPAAAQSSSPQSDTVDNLLRQYRSMWQKMSSAQQKAFLDSGGATPEQYERTLRTKGLSAVPPSPHPAASGGRQVQGDPRSTENALDSLVTSLQDLNAIRDGNLTRVQKDGCPPEVTSRLADLRGKLQQDEAELTGTEAPKAAGVAAKDRPAPGDAMAIASDWFKQPAKAENAPAAAASSSGDARESKLLADALSGPAPAAASARRIDPKSPEAQQRQKDLETEIAGIKAEITQLSGACATLKK